jgi:error-prone DNA polymerase
VFAKNRRTVMTAQFLEVHGKIEREGLVIHVIANELVDRSHQLCALGAGESELPRLEKEPSGGSWKSRSRDFH